MNKKIFFIFSLLIIIGGFLFIKLINFDFRVTDANIYFYTGKELLEGKLLYRDIFFTNFPLIPYVASIYFWISQGNVLFYYLTSSFEVCLTTVLISIIVLKQSKSYLLALCIPLLYLFSFMILATSQFQTGVFLTCLFIVISYWFFKKENYFLTGVFTALCLLAKAYALPVLLSYFVYLLIKKRKALLPFITGGALTAGIVLSPTLLFAYKDFLNDVFSYSLTRSQGVDKLSILWVLLLHDFIFIIILFTNMVIIRKNLLFGLFSLFGLLFFILYQDVYYLYLNILLPFLCLSLVVLIPYLQKKLTFHSFMIPTIVIILTSYNLYSYFSQNFHQLQRLPQTMEIVQQINASNPSSLYGINAATPLFAYLTNKLLLNNIVDTNDNLYIKGVLNATLLTKDSIKNHGMIITTGAYYPEAKIKEDILTEVVDRKLMDKHCKLVRRYPFYSEGITNSLNLFQC